MNEREIFIAALAKTDPAERAVYLDEACAGDAALRTHIEALLAAAPDSAATDYEGVRQTPPGPATVHYRPAGEAPGSRIGHYKLLQELGEGGMGTVWVAEQKEPVERRVALKVIKAGMDSKAVLARFEQERQALALMDHANIARMLDAGVTDAGRPYFVMELVKGVPMTKYCDQEHLSPRERLELFVTVCHAVQHAHQKGIIHRDLKPSNILVALYDGKPVVKVIDFGVAKATGPKLTAASIYTEVGMIVGTLEYMAPEQAELNNLDVDTRADVYSLGVVLYELLTGSPPFSGKQLRAAGFDEMRRVIREVEPSRPSAKLSSSADLPAIAAKRKLEPKQLTKLVRGELDWIVMKCLEKERGGRYATASDLSLDLLHYLHDEPVVAHPPSKLYRLGKQLRQHRWSVGVTAGFGVLAVVMVWLYVDALARDRDLIQARSEALAKERDLTQAHNESLARERDLTRIQRDEAVRQEGIARAMTTEAEESLRLAQGVMARFAAAVQSPLARRYEQAAARKEAQQAERRLATGSAGSAGGPDALRGERAQTAGEWAVLLAESRPTPEAVRQYDEVRRMLEVLVEKQPQIVTYQSALATTCNNLGSLYQDQGRSDLAEKAFFRAREVRERLVKANPKDVSSHEGLAGVEGNLALLYEHKGQLKEALAAFRRTMDGFEAVVAARPDMIHAQQGLATTCANLGILLHRRGQLDEAVKLCEKGQAVRRQLARTHPTEAEFRQHVAVSLGNLASVYLDAGRLQAAEDAYDEAVALQRKLVEDHPFVTRYAYELAQSLNNLGIFHAEVGRADRVEAPLREAVRLRGRLTSDHPTVEKYRYDLAGGYNNLGLVCSSDGRTKEAEDLYARSLSVAERLTKERPEVRDYAQLLAQTQMNRGNLFARTGRAAKAGPCYRQSFDLRKKLAEDHPTVPEHQVDLAQSYNSLGAFHNADGATDKAEEAYQAAAQIRARLVKAYPNVPEYRRQLATSVNNLGVFHYMAGRLDGAETAYAEALERRRELTVEAPAVRAYQHDLAVTHNNLALVYARTNRPEKAEESFKEAIRIGEELGQKGATIDDRATLAWSHGNLGVLCSQMKRPKEAAAGYRRAIDLLKDLGREQPDVPRFAVSLGLHSVNLAVLLHTHSGPEPALTWYGRAIDTLEPLLRDGAKDEAVRFQLSKAYGRRAKALSELKRDRESLPDWERAMKLAIEMKQPQLVVTGRLGLAQTWSRLGKHAKAAAEADELAAQEKAGGPVLLYEAAAIYAGASDSARGDKILDRADRDKAVERYAARAVELLGQAHAAGYFKAAAAVNRLRIDERLAPLRTRSDFQKLIELVERKARE